MASGIWEEQIAPLGQSTPRGRVSSAFDERWLNHAGELPQRLLRCRDFLSIDDRLGNFQVISVA